MPSPPDAQVVSQMHQTRIRQPYVLKRPGVCAAGSPVVSADCQRDRRFLHETDRPVGRLAPASASHRSRSTGIAPGQRGHYIARPLAIAGTSSRRSLSLIQQHADGEFLGTVQSPASFVFGDLETRGCLTALYCGWQTVGLDSIAT